MELDVNNDDIITSEAVDQAENFKAQGNEFLAKKEYIQAIDFYTRAIELNPENAIYYSNRSAAFLAKGDSISKALRDAEKCIELDPKWWKGYSRKGSAEHALRRFDSARSTYMEGLVHDPGNASLLAAAEEAYKAGEENTKILQETYKQAQDFAAKKPEPAAPEPEPLKKEDELLAAFLTEVENQKSQKDDQNTKKFDFGTPELQFSRLLQPQYQWLNLNPFRVLMLDTDATEDDMKRHYRKIAALIHPDKFRHYRAAEAFEELKKAYTVISNPDRRKTCIRVIKNARAEVEKSRRQMRKKGVPEKDLEPLEQSIDKALLKAFAEMENRRLNIEKREAAQHRREMNQCDTEKKKMLDDSKREKSWAQEDRRENRVGNWRDFQVSGNKRKAVDAHGWKGEKRKDGKKSGISFETDSYKKKWK